MAAPFCVILVVMIKTTIAEKLNFTTAEIRKVANGEKLAVAFSGGLDSTLVAALSLEALGRDKLKLINVCFGPYAYSKSLEIVLSLADRLGLQLEFVSAHASQEKIWKHGPSCNRCTREIKLPAVRRAFAGTIATGANQSDTWGQTGIVVKDGFYSPLRDWNKNEIKLALETLGLEVPRIGESPVREGCKLKHLLKIMANPAYHGYAVTLSNEVLLDLLEGLPHSVANVKIIGPLSKNIALVNVAPSPPQVVKARIDEALQGIDAIDEVRWVQAECVLTVAANPGLFNSDQARYWVEKGRLAPEFASPVRVEWLKSKNNRLDTFQVIDCQRCAHD